MEVRGEVGGWGSSGWVCEGVGVPGQHHEDPLNRGVSP